MARTRCLANACVQETVARCVNAFAAKRDACSRADARRFVKRTVRVWSSPPASSQSEEDHGSVAVLCLGAVQQAWRQGHLALHGRERSVVQVCALRVARRHKRDSLTCRCAARSLRSISDTSMAVAALATSSAPHAAQLRSRGDVSGDELASDGVAVAAPLTTTSLHEQLMRARHNDAAVDALLLGVASEAALNELQGCFFFLVLGLRRGMFYSHRWVCFQKRQRQLC